MHSILIIRLSSLGDVILATPLVRQLQSTYPKARIDVAVAERFAGVWDNSPRVTNVWRIGSNSPTDVEADNIKIAMMESVATEQHGRYDLIVDLQHNLRSAVLGRGLGSNVIVAPKFRLEKLALVWLKRRPATITNIASRNRKPLEHLPLVFDTQGCEVWLPEERAQGVYLAGQPAHESRRRIAVAPGAHYATKRWPVTKYAQLVRDLSINMGLEVVLVGGQADVEICTAVARECGVDVFRADGSTSVEATVRVLDTCRAIVSNDSGVMHLAAARRLPVVAIFGSTVKEFGFAPYGVPYRIVEHDVACRPCSHIGLDRCPKGHFNCMNGVTTEQVIEALTQVV